MTLARETELGKITVSNVIFAQIIKQAFEHEKFAGKIWPSSRKGRLIDLDKRMSLNDLANNIEVESGKDGENISLKFHVIVKFGQSISRVTDDLAEYIADFLFEKYGRRPGQIVLTVTGVKSKQIAKRELEVIKNYEA